MKKIISLLLLCIVLSSCGVFRTVKKDISKSDVQTVIKTDTNIDIQDKQLDKEKRLTIDKGVTVTEREITTKRTTPGTNVSMNADLLRLKNGETIRKDSAGIIMAVRLDSLQQNLLFYIQTPETTEEKTTKEKVTENKDKTTDSKKESSSNRRELKKTAITQEKQEKISNKQVHKDGKNSFWFVWLALGTTIIFAFIILRVFRRR